MTPTLSQVTRFEPLFQSITARAKHTRRTRALWFALVMASVVVVGTFMLIAGPNFSSLAWAIFFTGALIILYEPRYGLYLLLFFGLAGDGILTPWFPFVKNFSSLESLLYLHSSLIINPLEVYLGLTLLSWLSREVIKHNVKFYTGELFWPAIIFLSFVIFGLLYGLGTGGNLNIALWESRPIFYMISMLILTSNLLTKREHFSNLLWAAFLGLLVESIFANYYFFVILRGNLNGVSSLTEHAAAIHMNTVLIAALCIWLYQSSWSKRLGFPFLALMIVIPYLASQRRAAFLTFAIALVLLGIMLLREKPRAFWFIAPVVATIGLMYISAFWNNYGALGLPVQAIKSIIAEDSADAEDVASNQYREIENVNINFTIHQKPLTGVGFGQKFFILVPLPDISFFSWWDYLPHNSILWIWLKTGFGGFAAMLFLVGTAVMLGSRVLTRLPRNDLSVVALIALLYIVMHFLYAYVDISWDAQSLIYIGAMLGILNSIEHVVDQPLPLPQTRWPWQPPARSIPMLKPMSSYTAD